MVSESALEYRTRGVDLLARFVPLEEEHCAIAAGAGASALLARVVEQLAEVAFRQAVVEGNVTGDTLDRELSDLDVAVYFLRLVLAAVTAAIRIHPAVPQPLSRSKTCLLEGLDADVADWIEAHDNWDDLGAGFFIRAVTSLLKGAAAAACELDGLYETTSRELDVEDSDDNHGDGEPDAAVRFGDSLFQAATVAVAAAQWFEERHQEHSA